MDNFRDSNAYGWNDQTAVSVPSYAHPGNDPTYLVGGCNSHGLNAGAPSPTLQATTSQSLGDPQGYPGQIGTYNMNGYNGYIPDHPASRAIYQQTPKELMTPRTYHRASTRGAHVASVEERHDGDSYRWMAGSSVQNSTTMCIRPHNRTVSHRSAPYSIVYHQERSRAPIYNGNVYGDVKHFHVYRVDVAILQYLKEHAATGAMHDSAERSPPPLCHPGTREAVVYRILDWYGYQARPGKPIMWVYAPAGYGKTAIAGTISEKLEEKLRELNFNPLGGTFFFWRTSTERNSPALFIITLTYQLFISIPELAPHIENAVKRNPMILRKALGVQLKTLLVEPFQALGDTKGMPNRLIIIDGLDECINSDRESRVDKKYAEDQETVQLQVLDLIRTLASHQLPLSFLILSRPEPWIKQHIESAPFENLVEHVDLYEVGDHLKDVETFVKAELSRLSLDEEGLVTRLMGRANGHMLYASTVIRHIDCPYDDPRTRLENILNDYSNSNPDLAHSTPFLSLYELYRQILRSCPEGKRPVMISVLEEISAGAECFDAGVGIHQAVSVFDHIVGRVPGVYESNALVKRAISHVVTSHKAAILHVLQRHTFIADEWCTYFPEAVYEHLWILSSRPEGWDSDSVVHALKTLRQASLDIFDSLVAAVESESQGQEENNIFTDEENRSFYTLLAFIQDNFVCAAG
ncbi:hypothetical protein EST38_g11241 [Candolleomyces aberdarensis]|uniref:Nephrocystin 3-like N-terminal domain-containing protein n=1 Tax=Candolleomyces aberdarensis TaxID=2316362 RepID=A0A4Q2D5C4_9AGAR|nr:hypothetical protein EST38_g11241 [Candolleomyces aberdarensis]